MVAARPVATPVPPLGAADVPGLVTQLDDPKPEVRGRAARDLLRVEPFSAARSALAKVALLARGDPDEGVRCAAIATLGRYGPEPVVLERFKAALEAETPSVARAAASSLPAGGEVPLIRVALTNRDSSVRSTSLSRLRALPSSAETVALLEQALSDPNEHVRTTAAQVIAETAKGVASLGPALLKAASSEKSELTRGGNPAWCAASARTIRSAGCTPRSCWGGSARAPKTRSRS